MIVLVAEVAEALGDGVQPCCLRLVPQAVVRVGAVNDLGQQNNRGVASQIVLLDERVERTLLAVVTDLNVLYIERGCTLALGYFQYLLLRHKQEFSRGIDELPDEPRTGDPVDLHSFTRNPLHGDCSFAATKRSFGLVLWVTPWLFTQPPCRSPRELRSFATPPP